MKAAEIMRQPVLAATPGTAVRDVLTQLVMHNISGMPVVEGDGGVVGILSEDDILRTYLDGHQLDPLVVQHIMSADPVTVDVETPLIEVMQTIYEEGVLRVPVVEHGRLVGVISRGDLIMALAEPGKLGDAEFPIFHRSYGDPSDATPHLVHSYG